MLNWLEQDHGRIDLRVRVIPRAARDEIVGLIGSEALKVRIQAPPVEGKANACLVKFLARRWKIPRSNIEILSGETGRNKRLRINNPPPGLLEELQALDNR